MLLCFFFLFRFLRICCCVMDFACVWFQYAICNKYAITRIFINLLSEPKSVKCNYLLMPAAPLALLPLFCSASPTYLPTYSVSPTSFKPDPHRATLPSPSLPYLLSSLQIHRHATTRRALHIDNPAHQPTPHRLPPTRYSEHRSEVCSQAT